MTIQIRSDARFPEDHDALVALADGEIIASVRGNASPSSHLISAVERHIGRGLADDELEALAARESIDA